MGGIPKKKRNVAPRRTGSRAGHGAIPPKKKRRVTLTSSGSSVHFAESRTRGTSSRAITGGGGGTEVTFSSPTLFFFTLHR